MLVSDYYFRLTGSYQEVVLILVLVDVGLGLVDSSYLRAGYY